MGTVIGVKRQALIINSNSKLDSRSKFFNYVIM